MVDGASLHQIRPAITDLRDLVARLGAGDLSCGGRQALVPGPGHSKRDRSLSLKVSDDGTRVLFNSFAGDSDRAVMAYLGLENASGYKPSKTEIEAARRIREAEARRIEAIKLAFCAEVWEGTVGLEDTPAARYLWNRGLVLNGCADLRFHPAVPRKASYNIMEGDPPPPPPAPALVALARNGRGEPRGLHATFITDDGQKAFGPSSRLMFGPMAGAALRTAPVTADGVLAVAEGLETAGAYSILRSVPTWAAFSTSGISGFEVPLTVRRLIIAADHDENGAGMRHAEQLAERASRRCEVIIEMPPVIGDWADELFREAS